MRIAIIQFPGSNCESESIRAVRQAGMEAEEFLWNRDYRDLQNFDGYFIVGGFSYEDRSRSGVIASLDPLMRHIRVEAEKGKPVLGICNGAQILVETGLVPGLKNDAVGIALAENKRVKDGKVIGTGFYNTWVHMRLAVPPASSAFSSLLKPSQIIRVPVAHGEGRFVIPEELLEEMKANHLTAFRYCDAEGNFSEDFPTNPNGAAYNLAAVTNLHGNVMAMMPHPERTESGQPIFTSMRDYIVKQRSVILSETKNPSHSTTTITNTKESFAPTQDDDEMTPPLNFTPPPLTILPYQNDNTLEIITELVITDNEAATVQNTLRALGLPATITKATHWEIALNESADENHIREQIIASGELFNSNKERLINSPLLTPARRSGGKERLVGRSVCLLVRYRDDFQGQQKKEQLNLPAITSLKKGTLWKISAENDSIDELVDKILETHILFNQFSQECYQYDANVTNTMRI